MSKSWWHLFAFHLYIFPNYFLLKKILPFFKRSAAFNSTIIVHIIALIAILAFHLDNNLKLIKLFTLFEGDWQRIRFNFGISSLFYHFLDVCFYLLYVRIWWNDNQSIWRIQWCNWQLQMVFIANGNETNDYYFNGIPSKTDYNSWARKYFVYTNRFQKGKHWSHFFQFSKKWISEAPECWHWNTFETCFLKWIFTSKRYIQNQLTKNGYLFFRQFMVAIRILWHFID